MPRSGIKAIKGIVSCNKTGCIEIISERLPELNQALKSEFIKRLAIRDKRQRVFICPTKLDGVENANSHPVFTSYYILTMASFQAG
ncbi:hypothetical protein EMIT0P4_320002 [Pseudomonas sp. IT-P4]